MNKNSDKVEKEKLKSTATTILIQCKWDPGG